MLSTKSFLPPNLNVIASRSTPTPAGGALSGADKQQQQRSTSSMQKTAIKTKNTASASTSPLSSSSTAKIVDSRPLLTAAPVGTARDLVGIPHTLAYYDLDGDAGVVTAKDKAEDIERKVALAAAQRRARGEKEEGEEGGMVGAPHHSADISNNHSSGYPHYTERSTSRLSTSSFNRSSANQQQPLLSTFAIDKSDIDEAVRLRRTFLHAKKCCGVDDHWLITHYQQEVFCLGGRPVIATQLQHWLHSQPPPRDATVEALVQSFIHDHFHLAEAFVSLFEGGGDVGGESEGGESSQQAAPTSTEFLSCKHFCQVHKLSLADVASWLDGEDAYCRDKRVVKTIFEGVIRALKARRLAEYEDDDDDEDSGDDANCVGGTKRGEKKKKASRRSATVTAKALLASYASGEGVYKPVEAFRQRLAWEKADRGMLEHVIGLRRNLPSNVGPSDMLMTMAMAGGGGSVGGGGLEVSQKNGAFFALSPQNVAVTTNAHYKPPSDNNGGINDTIGTVCASSPPRSPSPLFGRRSRQQQRQQQQQGGGGGLGEPSSALTMASMIESAVRNDHSRGAMGVVGGGGVGGALTSSRRGYTSSSSTVHGSGGANAKTLLRGFGASDSYKLALEASNPHNVYYGERMTEAPKSVTHDYSLLMRQEGGWGGPNTIPPIPFAQRQLGPLALSPSSSSSSAAVAVGVGDTSSECLHAARPSSRMLTIGGGGGEGSSSTPLPLPMLAAGVGGSAMVPTLGQQHQQQRSVGIPPATLVASGRRTASSPTSINAQTPPPPPPHHHPHPFDAIGLHLNLQERAASQQRQRDRFLQNKLAREERAQQKAAAVAAEVRRLRLGAITPHIHNSSSAAASPSAATTTGPASSPSTSTGGGGGVGWRSRADNAADEVLAKSRQRQLKREFGVSSEAELRMAGL